MTRALELIGRANEESRGALRGLRLSQLSDLSLDEALAHVPEEMATRAQSALRIKVEGRPRSLQPVLLEDVYWIAREAILNAFRHAGASEISVEIEYARHHLRIIIRDNGCGIDRDVVQSGKSGHWGLIGMQERADRIGAKLAFYTKSGSGTEVLLNIPGRLAFHVPERKWNGIQRFFGFGHSAESD